MKKIIIFLIAFLLFLPVVFAKQGHMKLLAVSEENEQKGGIADLFLQIELGTGRVFLETFPLTRVDTQISTRFAKEIACEFSSVECDNFDFFYTITADSAIIAGPSAGAPITILTISLLNGWPLKEDAAITGTINSGGLVGPVGGLKAKIEAGKREGMSKILIPKGKQIREGNKTYSIENLSRELGIEIIEVGALKEALEHFTGKKPENRAKNVSIDPSYEETMKMLAIELCARSTKLSNDFSKLKISAGNETKNAEKNALNLTKKGREAFSEKMYYSSASYCFGANVEYSYLLLSAGNLTKEGILEKARQVKKDIEKLEKQVGSFQIKTITDLESYMVVKERLLEAGDIISLVFENSNETETSLRNLAFANERLNSAKSWATFMDSRGREFNLNKEIVKDACKKKISEVEERFQYVQIYFPQNLANTRKELDYAYKDLNNEYYELCLFKASKAKANVDIILSVFGIEPEQVDDVLKEKQKIVKENLIDETKKGIFPILGYSYYEYANALSNDDPFSAMLYSEYALELSNLDIYFKDGKKNIKKKLGIDKKALFGTLFVFIFGFVIGIASIKIIEFQRKKYKKFRANKK